MPSAIKVLDYALTTSDRIKELLTITGTGFDNKLIYLINGVSDWVESYCCRRFLETTYTNKVFSVENYNQKQLFLDQIPVSALTKIEYNIGTKSVPSWVTFGTDEYDFNAESGMVQFFSSLPVGFNNIRVTFTAGYKISFADFGDTTKHALPADLTAVAERMITKLLKRRESEGKSSESENGGSISWSDKMNEEDKATLARYKRILFV